MKEDRNFTIGVDFDRVLFKTEEFNEYLKETVGLHHVDADVYDEKGNYSPEKHARACGIEPKKIYDAMDAVERFLYDDIDVLQDVDCRVLIVTRGEKRFQRKKIESSGAEKFVNGVEIIEEGSKDVGIDFLIDDRDEELEKAGLDGFILDREENSLQDALQEVKK